MRDIAFIDKAKRLAIIAMFSDDYLMERLVLKGGNLLDIVYGISTRSSLDVDFSMEGDFSSVDDLRVRVTRVLVSTFREQGWEAFDITVEEKPRIVSDAMKPFWGGYDISFKVVDSKTRSAHNEDIQSLRRHAVVLSGSSTKFKIQMSKHEHCRPRAAHDLDGFTVYVYPPGLFVCEKVRAICQQMPEYRSIVHNHPSPRARDFVDICQTTNHFRVDFGDVEFRTTVASVFRAKRVPLHLIGQIGQFRAFHADDFRAVRDTIKPGVVLQEFDFYFDFVVSSCRLLEPLWHP